MHLKETISNSVETPKPEIKVYSKRPKQIKSVGSSKKAKIVESKIANNLEPNHLWGSNATDVSSFSSLINDSKFLGTVRFGNDQVAKLMGYGDYQLGNVIISKVYYVEGLGHNLFSIEQFCDADLVVAFRKNTCFIQNLEGIDLLSGSRDTNLYTISLNDMLKTSISCLLSKVSKTKSWLWHRQLSHLNFGKSKKSSHQPKAEYTNQEKLYLLHMDLCGLMRVDSINGKTSSLPAKLAPGVYRLALKTNSNTLEVDRGKARHSVIFFIFSSSRHIHPPQHDDDDDDNVETPCQVVQIILWYLDSGFSKHMTGNLSQLMNFVSKFLGTVQFGNDQIAKIMRQHKQFLVLGLPLCLFGSSSPPFIMLESCEIAKLAICLGRSGSGGGGKGLSMVELGLWDKKGKANPLERWTDGEIFLLHFLSRINDIRIPMEAAKSTVNLGLASCLASKYYSAPTAKSLATTHDFKGQVPIGKHYNWWPSQGLPCNLQGFQKLQCTSFEKINWSFPFQGAQDWCLHTWAICQNMGKTRGERAPKTEKSIHGRPFHVFSIISSKDCNHNSLLERAPVPSNNPKGCDDRQCPLRQYRCLLLDQVGQSGSESNRDSVQKAIVFIPANLSSSN
ncbi:hypothetical protein Tco_1132093 [Tanacetum coccineum]|uniref:Integrase, catalytic region, zinc finger, CCHC-type, peptidase aspartic, catalytic n=1 Tax=Tanacetum coccineum TaxID=301880 RepID=A0ABQ5JAW8_9ASTR